MKYRYHWTFKLMALILAIASGAAMLVGCAGLILDDLGYYERRRQSQLYNTVDSFCSKAARAVFDNFAWRDTDIEPSFFERFFRWGADVDAVDQLEYDFYYAIRSSHDGELLEGNYLSGMDWDWGAGSSFDVRRGFVTEMPKADYYPTYDEFTGIVDPTYEEFTDIVDTNTTYPAYEEFTDFVDASTAYTDLEGNPLPALGEGVTEYEYYVVSDDDSVNWQNIATENYFHADANGSDYTIYRMEYTGYESYYVEVYMTAEQTVALLDAPIEEEFLPKFLEEHHEMLGTLSIWGLALLLVSLLWLALTAGKSPYREDVKPEGLNRIPLDLYLGLAILGAVGVVALTASGLNQVVWSSAYGTYDGASINATENLFWDVMLFVLAGGCAGGILALLTMACAAQMKVGDNYWAKNSLIGICWKWGGIVLVESVKGLWKAAKAVLRRILGFFSWVGTFCKRLGDLLPLTWQWLLASGGVWLLMFFCLLYAMNEYSPFALFFGILVTVLLVLYGAYCFGVLRDAARKMSGGNLEEKIDNKYLFGCFGEFAGHLNALGDTCVEAARQQMKSERMKSELITNVSHDIKTPLTSIINYVDLLQRTEDEAERKEYLAVLDRQSQRLKKLIEDLMEMSRASSGNVAVEITPTDVCEAVNQALGEFADTLEGCNLTVLRKMPAEPVMALCDGKHLWRVLSNCLSNVVKYAMPGTRVYVDVVQRGQKVEISIKNISAQMLNITADELMERFVRGDSSRNAEGNGLGLNIAKSLMEVQCGRLELLVDGDLFKVMLTLNAA